MMIYSLYTISPDPMFVWGYADVELYGSSPRNIIIDNMNTVSEIDDDC